MARTTPKPLMPGDMVRVNDWRSIRATLDDKGCLGSLPFMPEMQPLCGKEFVIWRRVEKTCVEGDAVRRLEQVVYLSDLRCDGSAHDFCDKECRFFWKEAWLTRVDADAGAAIASDPSRSPDASAFPYPVVSTPGRYFCQSTELIRATRPLSHLDVRQYYRDIRCRTWTPAQMAGFLCRALGHKARSLIARVRPAGARGRHGTPPAGALGLEVGDCVKVKSREEIAGTLDSRGRAHGLEFTAYMLPFVGRRLRVRRRVRRIILETTGEMKVIRDTVTLEGATCDGHLRPGGCPRDVFHFWREAWLERASGSSEDDGSSD